VGVVITSERDGRVHLKFCDSLGQRLIVRISGGFSDFVDGCIEVQLGSTERVHLPVQFEIAGSEV